MLNYLLVLFYVIMLLVTFILSMRILAQYFKEKAEMELMNSEDKAEFIVTNMFLASLIVFMASILWPISWLIIGTIYAIVKDIKLGSSNE